MREIKFRMWGKGRGKYFPTAQAAACLAQQISGQYDHTKHGDIFEQYTGLHDKNGKEIYEGDVLSGMLGTAGRGAESRREKAARFIVEWIGDGYNLSAIDHYRNSSYRWYPNYQDCEVIGNIHENPELLNG